MAVWQFQVTLVPKRWLEAGGSIAALFSEEGWDPAVAWSSFDGEGIDERLGRVLPPGKSWSASLSQWGSDELDDIRLWRDNGRIASLFVRFDLRTPNMALFRDVARFVGEHHLAMIDPACKRRIHDLEGLLRAAGESNAAHFVLDPLSFLSQIDTDTRAT